MTKGQIRDRIKDTRSKQSKEDRIHNSKAIHNQLFESEAYRHCSKLFSFVSFGDEVDTKELIARALTDQKTVYVPRVEQKSLEFFEIHDLNRLVPSKFGVPEPEPDYEHIYAPLNQAQKDCSLMVMPGLAFDLRGNRVGYGAGYYDRYLSRFANNQFIKIAVAFDFQVIDQIPAEEFDVIMDAIITPTRIISCNC